MLISIDGDDFAWDYVGTLIKYHNSLFGTSLNLKDFHTGKLLDVLPSKFTHQDDKFRDIYNRLEKFHLSDSFVNMPILPNAREVITDLAMHHDIIMTTSVKPSLRETREYQCRRDFNGAIKEVYVTNNPHAKHNDGMTKGQLCRSLKVDIHGDDSPVYLEDCFNHGIPCYVLDAPWNQGETYGAQRVMNWLEISQRLMHRSG